MGLHDWACVHEGGGWRVGSNKLVELKKKKKEAKGTREKEWYTHWNAEFQRIALRGKKAFLSDQCKEIEENNRMGKTSDLFKKR